MEGPCAYIYVRMVISTSNHRSLLEYITAILYTLCAHNRLVLVEERKDSMFWNSTLDTGSMPSTAEHNRKRSLVIY